MGFKKEFSKFHHSSYFSSLNKESGFNKESCYSEEKVGNMAHLRGVPKPHSKAAPDGIKCSFASLLSMTHADILLMISFPPSKSQVINFQATICYGNNTKAVNAPMIILSADRSPNQERAQSGAPARKMRKIFSSNDALFIKINSQWASL